MGGICFDGKIGLHWELFGKAGRPTDVEAIVSRDDAKLVKLAMTGDSAAFGELVVRYQDRLYNSIVHALGCPTEAEDVVQEAFVLAYTKLSSFQQKSAFYTWLYRIAFNTAISRRRKKKPTTSLDFMKDEMGELPIDGGDAPESNLHRQERAIQVQQALAQLSDEHRTILVLREIEGFCYEAISEILDLPVGTVRSRLHRARTQMRDELIGAFQGDPSEG